MNREPEEEQPSDKASLEISVSTEFFSAFEFFHGGVIPTYIGVNAGTIQASDGSGREADLVTIFQAPGLRGDTVRPVFFLRPASARELIRQLQATLDALVEQRAANGDRNE